MTWVDCDRNELEELPRWPNVEIIRIFSDTIRRKYSNTQLRKLFPKIHSFDHRTIPTVEEDIKNIMDYYDPTVNEDEKFYIAYNDPTLRSSNSETIKPRLQELRKEYEEKLNQETNKKIKQIFKEEESSICVIF